MKIYHTATREDYYSLMIELEDKGVTWSKGSKPTTINNWENLESNTCISLENGIIEYSDTSYYNRRFPSIEIIEYKVKGEEMKHKLQATAFDVSVEIESFAKGLSEVESDLEEAKSSTKKLIEKLEEYLEYLKPKFKVGDYVTDTSDDDPFICKIEKFVGNDISGKWYCVSKKYFDRLVRLPISDSRLSTEEEIIEYESALQFHHRGRNPFEIKEGDLLEDTLDKFFAKSDYYDKKVFISKGLKFLKTAEEVNEWLGAEDE